LVRKNKGHERKIKRGGKKKARNQMKTWDVKETAERQHGGPRLSMTMRGSSRKTWRKGKRFRAKKRKKSDAIC